MSRCFFPGPSGGDDFPGSPAVDKGKTVPGVLFGQRGFARAVGVKPDIGAFEFDPDRIFGNGFNQ